MVRADLNPAQLRLVGFATSLAADHGMSSHEAVAALRWPDETKQDVATRNGLTVAELEQVVEVLTAEDAS